MVQKRKATNIEKPRGIVVFTDGSEKSGPTVWGFIIKNIETGDTLIRKRGRMEGTAQKAEVMVVLEALLHCTTSNLKRIEV